MHNGRQKCTYRIKRKGVALSVQSLSVKKLKIMHNDKHAGEETTVHKIVRVPIAFTGN